MKRENKRNPRSGPKHAHGNRSINEMQRNKSSAQGSPSYVEDRKENVRQPGPGRNSPAVHRVAPSSSEMGTATGSEQTTLNTSGMQEGQKGSPPKEGRAA